MRVVIILIMIFLCWIRTSKQNKIPFDTVDVNDELEEKIGWELFNSLTPEDKRLILEAIDELEESTTRIKRNGLATFGRNVMRVIRHALRMTANAAARGAAFTAVKFQSAGRAMARLAIRLRTMGSGGHGYIRLLSTRNGLPAITFDAMQRMVATRSIWQVLRPALRRTGNGALLAGGFSGMHYSIEAIVIASRQNNDNPDPKITGGIKGYTDAEIADILASPFFIQEAEAVRQEEEGRIKNIQSATILNIAEHGREITRLEGETKKLEEHIMQEKASHEKRMELLRKKADLQKQIAEAKQQDAREQDRDFEKKYPTRSPATLARQEKERRQQEEDERLFDVAEAEEKKYWDRILSKTSSSSTSTTTEKSGNDCAGMLCYRDEEMTDASKKAEEERLRLIRDKKIEEAKNKKELKEKEAKQAEAVDKAKTGILISTAVIVGLIIIACCIWKVKNYMDK